MHMLLVLPESGGAAAPSPLARTPAATELPV